MLIIYKTLFLDVAVKIFYLEFGNKLLFAFFSKIR